MGSPLKQPSAKLIIGLIGSDIGLFGAVKKLLQGKFGLAESESPVFEFNHTRYYEDEFGPGLKRVFIAYRKTVPLSRHHRIKLYTNRLEKKLSSSGKRRVNIDPGYLELSNLTLLTTKPRSNRVHLDSGIYAEVELEFAQNSFRPLAWTYPDYRTKNYIDFFNSVRRGLLDQTREARIP